MILGFPGAEVRLDVATAKWGDVAMLFRRWWWRSAKRPGHASRPPRPGLEALEPRSLRTTVVLLSGNAFGPAEPGTQTADAAYRLRQAGYSTVQLGYSTIATPAAFKMLANRIRAIGHGEPIGLVGFSAGGSLALRLAGISRLKVRAALDFYGPPDLSDWLDDHRGDRDYQYVTSRVRFTRALINELSGPEPTDVPVISAFGLRDTNVRASTSITSLRRDFPSAEVFTYDGPHGVGVGACPEAFDAFLARMA